MTPGSQGARDDFRGKDDVHQIVMDLIERCYMALLQHVVMISTSLKEVTPVAHLLEISDRNL